MLQFDIQNGVIALISTEIQSYGSLLHEIVV